MEYINIPTFESTFCMYIGVKRVGVHDADKCEGQFCCIHHPSDHPLKDATLQWRADRGMMERQCAHGVGHPDPDGVAFVARTEGEDTAEAFSMHGCCGCCTTSTD